jgi:hypothetical protein
MSQDYNTSDFVTSGPMLAGMPEIRLIISQPSHTDGQPATNQVVARYTFDYADEAKWLQTLRDEMELGNIVVVTLVSPSQMEEDFDNRIETLGTA